MKITTVLPFLFRFGSPEDDVVTTTAKGLAARLKQSPDRYLVAGDAKADGWSDSGVY